MDIQEAIDIQYEKIEGLKQNLSEDHYMNPEQEDELEELITEAIKFSELCAQRDAKAQAVPEGFILVPIKLSEDTIRNLAIKRFEEGQEYCTNKFGQFYESNKERWIQNQIGIIKNLYIDFLRTFESL